MNYKYARCKKNQKSYTVFYVSLELQQLITNFKIVFKHYTCRLTQISFKSCLPLNQKALQLFFEMFVINQIIFRNVYYQLQIFNVHLEEDFPMNSIVFGNNVVLSVNHVGALSLSNLEIPFTSTFPHDVLSDRKLIDGVK